MAKKVKTQIKLNLPANPPNNSMFEDFRVKSQTMYVVSVGGIPTNLPPSDQPDALNFLYFPSIAL